MYPSTSEFQELVTTPPVSMDEFSRLITVLLQESMPTPDAPLSEEAKKALCTLAWSYARLRQKAGHSAPPSTVWNATASTALLLTELLVNKSPHAGEKQWACAQAIAEKERLLAAAHDSLDRTLRKKCDELATAQAEVSRLKEALAKEAPCSTCARELTAAREATEPLLGVLSSWSLSWPAAAGGLSPRERWGAVSLRVRELLGAVKYMTDQVRARQAAIETVARVTASTFKGF